MVAAALCVALGVARPYWAGEASEDASGIHRWDVTGWDAALVLLGTAIAGAQIGIWFA